MKTYRRLLPLLALALTLSHNSLAADGAQPTAKSNQPAATSGLPDDQTPNGPIQDNSFLLEEAYNQEDGVIQHISFFQRMAGSKNWVYAFTDEWPLRTQKHQLSFTGSATHVGGASGGGDTLINYRYQAFGTGETKYAFAPRLSLLLPTGDYKVGRGAGGAGLQANLPFSVQHSKHFVTHWNAGATWIPNTKNEISEKARTVGVNLGQSMIIQPNNRFNFMLETVWYSNEEVVGKGKTERAQDIYMSPGVRWSHNFKSGLQIVPGVAVPLGVGPSTGEKGVIFYLSFEHPFAFAKSKS